MLGAMSGILWLQGTLKGGETLGEGVRDKGWRDSGERKEDMSVKTDLDGFVGR